MVEAGFGGRTIGKHTGYFAIALYLSLPPAK